MKPPEEVWDALVASALQKGSTTTFQRSERTATLRLRPDRLRSYFPAKDREISQIAPEVRAIIRGAVKGETAWPLLLLGPAGSGKTCAGLCLLDYAGGFYYTAAGLAEEVISAQKRQIFTSEGRPVSPVQLWQELATCSLVVLDELGARAAVSDHHYDCVKRLLDEREGRPMLVLSNLPISQIAVIYDDRVASRLAAGTVVRLAGADQRLRRE